jgi:hypothetical protein
MFEPGKSLVEVQPEMLDIFLLRKVYVVYMDWGAGCSSCGECPPKYDINHRKRRTMSSGMLRHVPLIRTDVSEERIASTRVTKSASYEQH